MSTYRIPAYDMDAFLIEAELLLDWYLPRFGIDRADRRCAQSLRALARGAAGGDRIASRPGCCATSIRPTCSGCRERSGARPGRPARLPGRRDGPGGLRSRLAAAGRARRRAGSDGGRAAGPLRAARRESRCRASTRRSSSGSTPRSRRSAPAKSSAFSPGSTCRDGKPQYLRHIPRVWGYLQRSLAHPALAPLKDWYDANVPEPFKDTI